MVDRPTTHLLSLKSLLVMSLSIGSFGLANSIEYSPYEGVIRRGVPLHYFESKQIRLAQNLVVQATNLSPLVLAEGPPYVSNPGDMFLMPDREFETMDTFGLVYDLAVAIVASVLLGIASERLFFNKARGTLRSGERPIC